MSEAKFIVRRRSGFAQKFVRNCCGVHANAVADKEASTFDQKWEAELKIREAGIDAAECDIEPINITED